MTQYKIVSRTAHGENIDNVWDGAMPEFYR